MSADIYDNSPNIGLRPQDDLPNAIGKRKASPQLPCNLFESEWPANKNCPPSQRQLISDKKVTVEDDPEDSDSVLSDGTRTKQQRVLYLSGSEHPPITLPDPLDLLLPLTNRNN